MLQPHGIQETDGVGNPPGAEGEGGGAVPPRKGERAPVQVAGIRIVDDVIQGIIAVAPPDPVFHGGGDHRLAPGIRAGDFFLLGGRPRVVDDHFQAQAEIRRVHQVLNMQGGLHAVAR